MHFPSLSCSVTAIYAIQLLHVRGGSRETIMMPLSTTVGGSQRGGEDWGKRETTASERLFTLSVFLLVHGETGRKHWWSIRALHLLISLSSPYFCAWFWQPPGVQDSFWDQGTWLYRHLIHNKAKGRISLFCGIKIAVKVHCLLTNFESGHAWVWLMNLLSRFR